MVFDWNVLARQFALILIPVVLAKMDISGPLSEVIAGPLADLFATLIVSAGFALVGWVVWLGQRREKPAAKIEEVADLGVVRHIELNDAETAADIPSAKVTA